MNEKLQKREPYRPLSVPEKELLFAMYDKHNGNLMGMIRDRECVYKSRTQLSYYKGLYHFAEHLVHLRTKRNAEVLNSLKDSKILAIQQAIQMIETRQVPLKNKQGDLILDADGQPMFYSVGPDHKEIEMAWKIIKTELGEPTTIGKHDHTSKGERIRSLVELNEKESEDHESIFKRDAKQTTDNNIETSDSGGVKDSPDGTEGGAYETR
ncbi:MAG: hypothetical protein KBD47_00205 [Candidatus Pacebacteria bacterium]|nr:hypothetical protein [Candidatus Paceibacterota bacterium]